MRLECDRALVAAVAVLTASAGVIHMAMVPMHAEHRFSMAMFLAGGLAQLALVAFLVVGDRSRALVATAAVNAGAASLWAVTRVRGVGFLPGFEARQRIEAADLAATAFEIAAIATAVVALRLGRRRRGLVPAQAMPAFGVACAVVLAAALAVPSDHSGHAHGDVAGHHGDHAVGAHPHDGESHHDGDTGEHVDGHVHVEGHGHAVGDAHRRGHEHALGAGSHTAHDEGSHGDHADHADGHAHDEHGDAPPSDDEDPDPAPNGSTEEPSDLKKVCSWYAPPTSECCP